MGATFSQLIWVCLSKDLLLCQQQAIFRVASITVACVSRRRICTAASCLCSRAWSLGQRGTFTASF